MSVRYAFATLLTSDAYLPGALTIAGALKDVHRLLPSDQTVEYETVCLVTPETVDVTSIRLLRKAFDVVVGVETIVPPDTESLSLLGRPDLGAALTKLHVFRLWQYSKVIFLDADALPLRPLSHLFHLDHEFSAVPDVGWPDIFNSGVMVLSPGEDKFEELRELLNTQGSWDGADQGLLNEWRGDDWNRLSFTYNTTPTAIYTYAPAYRRFGSRISVVHFIGPHKPWHTIPYRAPGSSAQSTDTVVEDAAAAAAASARRRAYDYGSLVDRWYSVYDRHYRSQSTEPVFEPTRYGSAWNDVGPGALGLAAPPPRTRGDGEYRSIPLDGRFDLIRPRTRAERTMIGASADIPATPRARPVSLPPTPLKRDAGAQTVHFGDVEPGHGPHRSKENTPDRSKVRRVFPWEERPRPAPGRVFPDEGSLLPVPATPERKAALRSLLPSPLVDFPPSLQPYYPSEGALTQRHPGKRSVLSSGSLRPKSELGGIETSSQDGDVEDEVDSGEETEIRSRTQSIEMGMAERTQKYRSVGVQTDPIQVREEGVQVTTFAPQTEPTGNLRSMHKGWFSPPTSALFSPTPDSRHSLSPYNTHDHTAPPMPASDTSSPFISSLAPSSPGNPFHSRKGSRVWDPARGVEAFKRGSEEVLTKFLKIGSS